LSATTSSEASDLEDFVQTSLAFVPHGTHTSESRSEHINGHNDCILPHRLVYANPARWIAAARRPKLQSPSVKRVDAANTLSAMASAAYFLAAALVVLYILRSIRTYLSLNQFGGHWSAGWSRLWLLKTQSSGEMHKRFAALNRKHGEYSTRHGFFSLPLCW
jgi:hypothetical protein